MRKLAERSRPDKLIVQPCIANHPLLSDVADDSLAVVRVVTCLDQHDRPVVTQGMHDLIAQTGAWVYSVLKGHLNYFAVSGNDPSLWWFFNQVKWHWLRSLRRRSQRAYINWERYIRLVDRFLPPIRILHPLRYHRFDARTRGRSPVR
ncbi:hypothetical protein [Dongia deserti]|uniref:hypothetical protein n=1 Tax=Dongia deserti TaxID=2268030 RepID=UPI000E6550BF|nr:hypothetical protein [Dongia deserti]